MGKAQRADQSIPNPLAVKPTENIPDWIHWIAQDGSGAWWGYAVEPLRNDTGWYENEVGECLCLGHTAPGDWQHSLQRVR